MPQRQSDNYSEQCYEHMYHKVHVELAAHLLLVVLPMAMAMKRLEVVTIIVLMMLMKVMMQAMTEYNP